MTKEDDVDAYIKSFERKALQAGLDKALWASQLGSLLIDKAQAIYRSLPSKEAYDYDKVKTMILYQLEIMPKHYRRCFRARKGREKRQPRVFM